MAGLGYAFIDTRSLLESFMKPLSDEPAVEAVPCELDDEWTEFEKVLTNFKTKFSLAKTEANVNAPRAEQCRICTL